MTPFEKFIRNMIQHGANQHSSVKRINKITAIVGQVQKKHVYNVSRKNAFHFVINKLNKSLFDMLIEFGVSVDISDS